jgi:hypothetical protein
MWNPPLQNGCEERKRVCRPYILGDSNVVENRTRIALSLDDIRKEYSTELERQQIILGKVADEFGLEGFDI